jgi:molybdopterin/thiamine biosynthesis adenylyltransferase
MIVPPAHFKEVRAAIRTRRMQTAPVAARLPQFFGATLSPAEMAKSLARARVFLIGAGSVGRIVAAHCARLGVKELKIADPKRYTNNLITQSITPGEVGKCKASSTGRLVKSISPRTRVLVFDGPAQDLPPTEFADTDVVALATDNLSIELAVTNLCVQFGTALTQGSVHGETLTVQIRCLANRDPAGPCLCCQYGPEEHSAMAREVTYSCEGRRRLEGPAQAQGPATMSTSALCSLCADLLITTWLRVRLGLGAPVTDTLLEYNCYAHRATTAALKRNPACIGAHERFSLITAKRALGESTPRGLAKAAGHTGGGEALLFTVDNLLWAEAAACQCVEPKFASRFIPAGQLTAGRCTRCHQPYKIANFMTRRAVPADVLGPALDEPLRALGAAQPQTVLVRLHNKPILFRNPPNRGATK